MDLDQAVGLLMTAEGRADPYPTYAAMRAHGPFVHAGGGFHVVTGYAAVAAALREPKLFVHDAALLERVAPGWDENRSVRSIVHSMLQSNPPDHTRMRRLAAGAFTARRVAALRETISGYATELTDRLADLGTADFMAEYAYPLPVRVICALLGVPASDHAWFRERAVHLTVVLEPQVAAADLADADAATAELEDYFVGLVAERRRTPGDDLTSALIQAMDHDGALTGRELLANLILLLVAGFETTTNLLGNGLVVLLDHPEQAAGLSHEPAAYVEELLRFDSPVQLTSRWATEPVTVAGVTLRAGNEVLLLIGAANRDPERVPEPDRFDPGRPANQPISFGAGAHYCLGAALARLEAQVALPALLRRFPNLALADEPVRRDRLTLRGYASLPVTTG